MLCTYCRVGCGHDAGEPELMTQHGWPALLDEADVTDGAPHSVLQEFRTSFIGARPSSKTHGCLAYSYCVLKSHLLIPLKGK